MIVIAKQSLNPDHDCQVNAGTLTPSVLVTLSASPTLVSTPGPSSRSSRTTSVLNTPALGTPSKLTYMYSLYAIILDKPLGKVSWKTINCRNLEY